MELLGVSDFQYSEQVNSRYMSLFSGHGVEVLDTRRMSVLESIPISRLEELNERLDHLRDCFDLFDDDAEAMNTLSKWKMTHASARNREPEAPADYADFVLVCTRKSSRSHRIISMFPNCVSSRCLRVSLW